jgi:hypothetical protein
MILSNTWRGVDLCQIVLECVYTNSPPYPDRLGSDFYTGIRFHLGKTWWLLTRYKNALVPDNKPEDNQPALFYIFSLANAVTIKEWLD